jgi:hypothetical protein
MRKVRVFLASSEELKVERESFAEQIAEIQKQPQIERNFELVPVVWELDARGAGRDIDQIIHETVRFHELDIVVVLVWNKIGSGTRKEFDYALQLNRLHRSPRLLAYSRLPRPDADPQQVAEVTGFIKDALGQGVVIGQAYETPEAFFSLLARHLPLELPHLGSAEPARAEVLRRRFWGTAIFGIAMTLVLLFTSQTMSFPDIGVSETKVFTILFGLPVLGLTSLLLWWTYRRLLRSLKAIWYSPVYSHKDVYQAFHDIVPAFALPSFLRSAFPAGAPGRLLATFWLTLAFGAPILGQSVALFGEMLTWEYTVGSEVYREADGKPLLTDKRTVRSRHVDQDRDWWPFGLQDAEARRKIEEKPDAMIFVHANGGFKKDEFLEPDRMHLRNRGPQVFLPAQLWIYFGLFLASCTAVVSTGFDLFRFHRFEVGGM